MASKLNTNMSDDLDITLPTDDSVELVSKTHKSKKSKKIDPVVSPKVRKVPKGKDIKATEEAYLTEVWASLEEKLPNAREKLDMAKWITDKRGTLQLYHARYIHTIGGLQKRETPKDYGVNWDKAKTQRYIEQVFNDPA